MSLSLPASPLDFMDWPWAKIAPYVDELLARPLDSSNVSGWLADWSRLTCLLVERANRLQVATALDTTDGIAEQGYKKFLDEIYPHAQAAEQQLKEKLLASGLEPAGFAIPLRNQRAEAALFRQANLPLQADEIKLGMEYDQIVGGQTVEWEGQELTVSQLQPIYQDANRQRRERAWRLAAERQLADRQKLNAIWQQMFTIRRQIAANAGLPDYRAYRWQQNLRFDYTPEDCETFHRAIESVVVPAVQRQYEKRRRQLGVESLRPWDLNVDPLNRPALKPFASISELETKAGTIFQQVDPQLGEYYALMQREGLMDLGNRKGKAPGAFCTEYAALRRPFIFVNAVGLHNDVQTTLHESGHAFHVFETAPLPYYQQLAVGAEFAEVASMGMELLASPYLAASAGGFYSQADAARALTEHLESLLRFWPYMAVVDAFQHWAYTHPNQASEPQHCDEAWGQLWDRFMAGVDWSGLNEERKTGWQRKLHIFQYPFYYVEYGLAQLGAVQVWRGALQDQAGAVAKYRQALSLGGTVPLPQLFEAAGARLAFDAATLGEAVELIETTIAKLEA